MNIQEIELKAGESRGEHLCGQGAARRSHRIYCDRKTTATTRREWNRKTMAPQTPSPPQESSEPVSALKAFPCEGNRKKAAGIKSFKSLRLAASLRDAGGTRKSQMLASSDTLLFPYLSSSISLSDGFRRKSLTFLRGPP